MYIIVFIERKPHYYETQYLEKVAYNIQIGWLDVWKGRFLNSVSVFLYEYFYIACMQLLSVILSYNIDNIDIVLEYISMTMKSISAEQRERPTIGRRRVWYLPHIPAYPAGEGKIFNPPYFNVLHSKTQHSKTMFYSIIII